MSGPFANYDMEHLPSKSDEIERLQASVDALEAVLTGDNGALTRMDRAREILSKHSHTWQMLNTADIRAALKGDSDE